MKVLKVCLIACLLWGAGVAEPKTAAQKKQEQAARQREHARHIAKERQRDKEFARDRRDTARDHRKDTTLGDHIVRNAQEGRDNLHDVGRQIRDWFDF